VDFLLERIDRRMHSVGQVFDAGVLVGLDISFFVSLITQKRAGQAVKGVAAFLGGMLAATIPWIIYFGVNHAITDWLNTYFVINLTGYAEDFTFTDRILNILSVMAVQLVNNPIFGVGLWFGIIAFSVFKKFIVSFKSRALIVTCFFCSFWGSIGQDWIYLLLSLPGAVYYFRFDRHCRCVQRENPQNDLKPHGDWFDRGDIDRLATLGVQIQSERVHASHTEARSGAVQICRDH